MSDGSNVVPAVDDGQLSLQIIMNSITLASFVSQLVILVTFVPDLQVFPTSLRVLSLGTIIFSMLSSLAVFLSSNYACNPAVGIGCTLLLIGNFCKWCTYALRIWLLTYKRNLFVLILMSVSTLLTTGLFQWWCSGLSAVRILPRLCAPVTNPSMSYTEPLASAMAAGQNFVYIVLHVYFLWDYFREVVQGTAILSGKKKLSGNRVAQPTPVQNNRLAATLTLFASSILVMITDMVLGIVRTIISTSPFVFFLVVFGGQIISDIIYCAYMRRFATALLQEKQSRSIPALAYAPPSTNSSDREYLEGVPGPDYVSIDGNRMNLQSYRTEGIKTKSPVEMPSPFPPRHSDRFSGQY